jgi:hypothetical protein
MIVEVFSSDKLPKCRMAVRRTIHTNPGRGLDYAKRDMARALADRILEEERLFSSEQFGPGNEGLIGISLDCLVISESELRSLLNEAFLKGREQGRYGL